MMKFYSVFAFIIFNASLYGQYNLDANEIKSINFSNEAECSFDKKGRLIEYRKGDLKSFLDNTDVKHGQIEKYTIDSLGNFTQCTVLNYSICRQVLCQPDTINYAKGVFDGTELEASFAWLGDNSTVDLAYYSRSIFKSHHSRFRVKF